MRQLPTGTVTFLFSDIEGSTRLLQELGDGYADALAEHRRLMREAVGHHGGVEVDTQGDAFFVAFGRASDAVAGAAEAQRAHADGLIGIRIGIHTGEPTVTPEGYVGIDVHRAARICSAAHAGQIVLSETTGRLLDGETLRDLGKHRLKDLEQPVRLYQVGEDEFPPLRSLNQTNLPAQSSRLVGREHELADLRSLVRYSRLLTLTGSGGSGKTRLALQAAAELVESFDRGVFWVPLAGVFDPELVEPTVAQAIGAHDGLAEHVGDKEVLLVLDNLEQLLEAAPKLSELLESCPNLHLLVTSRARLRIAGEREYQVDPLPEVDAVELFRERAVVAEPAEAVAETCRRLDGLPLAIELAAARTRVLPPVKLLERLERALPILTGGRRDAPERQRTLHATIEWSYDLLSEEEKVLFSRLAVFVGGFTLEAADEVVEADLDTLESLIEKSLVRRDGERFSMLEMIREYALERFGELSLADEVLERHAQRYLAFAEEHSEPRGPGAAAVFDRLALEQDNMRAALGWFLETGRLEEEQRLAVALSVFWNVRGYFAEGQRWLEVPWDSETAVRAKALARAAGLAADRGRHEDAARLTEESAELYERLGDRSGIFHVITNAGLEAVWCGERQRAESLLTKALDVAHAAADDRCILIGECNLGYALLAWGDNERAVQVLKSAKAKADERGDTKSSIICATNLGFGFFALRRLDDAMPLLREGLELARDLGFSLGAASCLEGLAAVDATRGRGANAARLLAAAERAHRELGAEREVVEQELYERTSAEVARALTADERAAAEIEGGGMTLSEAVEYALANID